MLTCFFKQFFGTWCTFIISHEKHWHTT